MEKTKAKKIYKKLNKFEKNGKLKAINDYGSDGLYILDYLYTEFTEKNTTERKKALFNIINLKRSKFEEIADIVENLIKEV